MPLTDWFRRRSPAPAPSPSPAPFPVAEQLAELERFGIRLAPGVTLDQVLAPEGTRDHVQQRRFGLLAELALDDSDDAVQVRTVPGVAFQGSEGVEDDDSYEHVVRRLARASGRSAELSEVRGHFDPEAEEYRLEYELAGRRYQHEPDVVGDWFDGMTVGSIAEDFAPTGLRCAWWIDDDGTWCTWLPPQQAGALVDLMNQHNPLPG